MSNELQTTPAREPATATRSEGGTVRYAVPPVDVFEDEGSITLLADLPGVSRERLGVRVDGDNLVIEGTAEVPAPAAIEMVERGQVRLEPLVSDILPLGELKAAIGMLGSDSGQRMKIILDHAF